MISQRKRHGLSAILLGFIGIGELCLWKVGHTNQYGLYIGIALIVGAVINAVGYIKLSKKI